MTLPGRSGKADFPAPRRLLFSSDDLRWVRRVTALWAAYVGLPANRAEDFVIAVHEIAANAVRYGSPVARLLLRVADGAAAAEIHDGGYWQPFTQTALATGPSGGMGLELARQICEVEIQTGTGGTTVLLRMSP